MLHVVQKPISGPGGTTIPSGQLVEPSNWRNFGSLMKGRYLRPVTPEDVAGLDEVDVDDLGVTDHNIFTRKVVKKATIRKAGKKPVKH